MAKIIGYTHLVYIRQDLPSDALATLCGLTAKWKSTHDSQHEDRLFLASNVRSNDPVYLSFSAHYDEGLVLEVNLPHGYVLCVMEARAAQYHEFEAPQGAPRH